MSYRLQVWIILFLIEWQFVGVIVCFSGKCSSERAQILIFYATKNNRKNDDIRVFKALVRLAEGC